MPVLQLERLRLTIAAGGARVPVLREVSFSVDEGEIVGLVGESGSGKSLTLRAVTGLEPRAADVTGRIQYRGQDLLAGGERGLRELRGRRIGMVWQEPRASLNPVLTIGAQVREVLAAHRSLRGAGARAETERLLRRTGMPADESWADRYPHQLSGGQCQRATIAIALAGGPDLLLADEPTSALDPTVQGGILELLDELRRDLGLAVVLVTHDLGVARRICDRIVVLYAGEVVERAATEDVFLAPAHPYTHGLLAALPELGRPAPRGEMPAIPGSVPEPARRPPGCAFHPRCPERMEICSRREPAEYEGPDGRPVRCFLHDGEPRP